MPRLARASALVIESDADYRLVIAACVGSAGVQVEAVEAVSEGLRRLQAGDFELVIWGVPLQDPRRAHIVAQFHEEAKVPLILLDESYEEARESFEAGADQVLPQTVRARGPGWSSEGGAAGPRPRIFDPLGQPHRGRRGGLRLWSSNHHPWPGLALPREARMGAPLIPSS